VREKYQIKVYDEIGILVAQSSFKQSALYGKERRPTA